MKLNHLRSAVFAGLFVAMVATLAGCGSSNETVIPPKVEEVPATSGPVDEPPSTDEK